MEYLILPDDGDIGVLCSTHACPFQTEWPCGGAAFCFTQCPQKAVGCCKPIKPGKSPTSLLPAEE